MATVEDLAKAFDLARENGDTENATYFAQELVKFKQAQDRARQEAALPAGESGIERPPEELQPQPFYGEAARQEANLNKNVSRELIAELRQAQTGEAPTATEVESFKKTAGSKSTRDFFDNLVAKGGIDITSSFDPQTSPALAGAWEKYKQEKEPSMLGAAARGAAEQIAPTIGGAVGGFLGGTMGPVGAIGGAVTGGAVAGKLQQELLPETEAQAAQRAFDESQRLTSAARTAGSFAPSLTMGVPSVGKLATVAGMGTPQAVGAARRLMAQELAIGAAAGAAGGFASAALDGRLPSGQEILNGAIESAALGAVTRPTALGRAIMTPRAQRTDIAARESAQRTMREFAGATAQTPQEVPQRIEAAARAIETGTATSPGAQLFAGEVSGNEGLLGLQEALVNSQEGARLREVRQQSRAAIARDLGQSLAPQGAAGIQEAQAVIQQQHDNLIRAAEAARENAIAAGNQRALAAFEEAVAQSRQNFADAESGLLNADTALAASRATLERTLGQFAQAQQGRSRADFSRTVESVLQRNAAEEKAQVDRAYGRAREEAGELAVDFTNTIDALTRARRQAGIGRLPGHIERMLDAYVDNPEPNRQLRVEDIDSNYRNISGELSDTDNRTFKGWLQQVKDALRADLESAGRASELFRDANRLYFEYAQRYIDGPAAGVVAPEASKTTVNSKTIDAYTKNEESLLQLRDSIKGDQNALNSINQWFVDKFAEQVGASPTTTAMDNWAMDQKNRDFARVFPEAMQAVRDAQAGVRQARAGVEAATEARGAAREQVGAMRQERTAQETGARQREIQVEQERRRAARETFRTEQERIQANAANRILGRSPQSAVQAVFDSPNPAETAAALMRDLRGNPEAIQGFRNAVSNYLNERFRSSTRVETTLNAEGPVTMEEFAGLAGRMNDFLTQGAETRQVLETVYGANSREMRALDIIRRQYEVMARAGRATAGQSQTALRTSLKDSLSEINKNNALGALQRIATGMGANEVSAVNKIFGSIANLLTMTYRGDSSRAALKILAEAQTNPRLAAELLRGTNADTVKNLRPYVKFYAQRKFEQEKK
jgi:hypothetical protein